MSFVFFFFKTLWSATVFPRMVFFSFFYDFFFQNCLCRFFFSYWAGWEFSFVFFFFKTMWIATVFPRMILFLLWCFSKLSLSILLFLILSWLRIITIDFFMKHYRLLQCFPAWFFFVFFVMIFFKIFFVYFIF